MFVDTWIDEHMNMLWLDKPVPSAELTRLRGKTYPGKRIYMLVGQQLVYYEPHIVSLSEESSYIRPTES